MDQPDENLEISARVDLGERALTNGLKMACVCAVMHVNELCFAC